MTRYPVAASVTPSQALPADAESRGQSACAAGYKRRHQSRAVPGARARASTNAGLDPRVAMPCNSPPAGEPEREREDLLAHEVMAAQAVVTGPTGVRSVEGT